MERRSGTRKADANKGEKTRGAKRPQSRGNGGDDRLDRLMCRCSFTDGETFLEVEVEGEDGEFVGGVGGRRFR